MSECQLGWRLRAQAHDQQHRKKENITIVDLSCEKCQLDIKIDPDIKAKFTQYWQWYRDELRENRIHDPQVAHRFTTATYEAFIKLLEGGKKIVKQEEYDELYKQLMKSIRYSNKPIPYTYKEL